MFRRLQLVLAHADEIGAFAVVVDAIDDRAAQFYVRYGFQAFRTRPTRLFLPLATVADMFA